MSKHYDGFWHIPAESDISNLATATIEVMIAIFLGILAIVISWKFYQRGQADQSHYASETNDALQKVGSIVNEEKTLRDNRRDSFKIALNNLLMSLDLKLKSITQSHSLNPNTPFHLDMYAEDVTNLLLEFNDVLLKDERAQISSLRLFLESVKDNNYDDSYENFIRAIYEIFDTLKEMFDLK